MGNLIFNLDYNASDGTLKTISIPLRFLSSELRPRLVRCDIETQKSLKNLEKENQDIEERSAKNREIISQKIEAFKQKNPKLDENAIDIQRKKIEQEILNATADDEFTKNEDYYNKIWRFNDERSIEYLKLIVDVRALEPANQELFKSEVALQSEEWNFWKSVDIEKVKEINLFFRESHNL